MKRKMSRTFRYDRYRQPRYPNGSTYVGQSGRYLKRLSHRAERRMAKAELRGEPADKLRGYTAISDCNWRGW